jgi:hypothetical protein
MNEKVIIHPVELKRRRNELIDMVVFNEEIKKKVIQLPLRSPHTGGLGGLQG